MTWALQSCQDPYVNNAALFAADLPTIAKLTLLFRTDCRPDHETSEHGKSSLLLDYNSPFKARILDALVIVTELLRREAIHLQAIAFLHVRPGGFDEAPDVCHSLGQVELGHHPAAVSQADLNGC